MTQTLEVCMPQQKPPYFTVAQIAAKFGVATQRVYELIRERQVKGSKIGELRVFTADEVKQLKPGKPGRPWHKERNR